MVSTKKNTSYTLLKGHAKDCFSTNIKCLLKKIHAARTFKRKKRERPTLLPAAEEKHLPYLLVYKWHSQ